MSEFNDRVRDSSALLRLREVKAELVDLEAMQWQDQATVDRKALLVEITPLYVKGGLTPHDAGDKVAWTDYVADAMARRNRKG